MKSSDLRTGNLVYYRVQDEMDYRKEWNELNIIDAEDILSIEAYEIAKQDHPYSYIPLTDEWMNRFYGYMISGNSISHFSVLTNDEETDIVFELMNDILTIYANNIIIGIYKNPSVHQFQNLYFCLVGNELNIRQLHTI